VSNLLNTQPQIINERTKQAPRKVYKARSGHKPATPAAMRAASEEQNKRTLIWAAQRQVGSQPSSFPAKPEPLPSRKARCLKLRRAKNPDAQRPFKAAVSRYQMVLRHWHSLRFPEA
jgi:hypothetical protein